MLEVITGFVDESPVMVISGAVGVIFGAVVVISGAGLVTVTGTGTVREVFPVSPLFSSGVCAVSVPLSSEGRVVLFAVCDEASVSCVCVGIGEVCSNEVFPPGVAVIAESVVGPMTGFWAQDLAVDRNNRAAHEKKKVRRQ